MTTQKPKLTPTTWRTLDRNNKYFEFITQCKNKKYPETTPTHLHHVIPQYAFGQDPSKEDKAYMDSSTNIVILSVEDHTKAHELLYEIYGNAQDRGAVLMLSGYEQESRAIWRKLGAVKVNELMKDQQKTFWDPVFQKKMAARSMARVDAIEIRSKAGKVGGTNRQRGRAIGLEDRYLFCLNDQPMLCIFNCDSGTQVLEELNKCHKTPLQRVSPLLNGTRASLHGWSCKKF